MQHRLAHATLTAGGRPYPWRGASGPPTVLSASVTSEATIELDASGGVTVTVLSPPEFSGVYSVFLDDLATGPLNLVAPSIDGTPAVSETLTTTPGLWIYDADAGDPVLSYGWLSDGSAIPGELTENLVVTQDQSGRALSVMETATDQNGGRAAVSAPLEISGGVAVLGAADGAITIDDLNPHIPVSLTGTQAQIDVEAL